MADEVNIYDQFDDVEPQVLTSGPRPTFGERFNQNFENAMRHTLLGVAVDASTEYSRENRKEFDRKLEALPEWNGKWEGLAALSGEVAGSALAVENFIPIGRLFKLGVATKSAATGLWASVFAGSVDAAAGNAIADAAVQGIEIEAGFRDAFDPVQYGASIALGAGIGGIGGGAGKLVADALERARLRQAEGLNPFDALDEPAAAPPTPRPAAQPLEARAAVDAPAPVARVADQAADAVPPAREAAPAADAAPPAREVAPAADAEPQALGEKLSAEAIRARNLEAPARPPEPDRPVVREDRPRPPDEVLPPDDITASNLRAAATDGAPDATPSRVAADPADTVSEFMMAERGKLTGERSRENTEKIADTAIRVERVRETAENLAKMLEVHATRQGRISNAKALGIYSSPSGVVRVRSLDDFDVLSHEYGHHVDAHVPEVKDFIKQNSAELRKLDYDPVAGRDYEGFAEFFRLWLTNREFAWQEHPALAAKFDKVMTEKAPEMARAIDDATEAWNAFLTAPSSVAVKSTIVSSKRGGWVKDASDALKKGGVAGTITDVLQRIYTFTFDNLNPIARSVSALQQIHFENTGKKLDVNVASDPYKLARMSRGAYSAGHMDIMYGVAGYRKLNPETPSLRDAIVEATGKPNALSRWDGDKVTDFGSYLWSRRALGEWERYRAGKIPYRPDKLTEADHAENIAELAAANPQFVTAAEKVYLWSRGLWKKKFDAGLIDETAYLEGLAIKDYVPGLRDWNTSDTDMKTFGPTRGDKRAKSGFVRRFKGSKRDVINPLESMAADAYETSLAIARNDVVKMLHRLSLQAGLGGGKIAELIPAKEMRGTMIDPIEAVESAARKAGLSGPDITVLRDAIESAIGDEKASIYRPAMINEKGEPIVFFRDGGELKALRLADGQFGLDMYKALTSMSAFEKNFWIDLMAWPARILRAGITTSFEFIGANMARDQAMSWVLYGQAFERIGNTVRGGIDDVRSSVYARNYSRAYGLIGGAETASLGKVQAKRDLSALRRKGWRANRLTSVRGLIETVEISETATRIGLFRTFQKEAAARGLSEYEAVMEASWRARDYIDFNRRGSGMAAVSRLIPFFNAALQGSEKTARHMIAPLARKMMGLPANKGDEAAMALAVKSWARLGALTVAGMSLYALASRHEDYDEVSATTKATHWIVKAGERWVVIPKPYEFATVLNLGEAMFDTWVKHDKAAMNRWLDSQYLTLMPPSLIEDNPAIKSYFELKSNTNFFTGAPIVPDDLLGMEPFLQYTSHTSMLSRQLGKAFDVSPLVIDHLVTAHLGSWGRNALSAYDLAQPDAPGFAWDDAPITRRFIKDAAKGSQSVTMFWDQVSQTTGKLEGNVKSWKAMAETGDRAGAADYYASLNDTAKVYVATAAMDADVRRIHPLMRARNAVQAIGAMRRDMAAGRLTDAFGDPIDVTSAERTAGDDILSTLSMAITRNALTVSDIPGWTQRAEIDEDGFYRELEALNPAILERLGSGYAAKKVYDWAAVKAVWPELRERALAEGSEAFAMDLAAEVQSAGAPVFGLKPLPQEKPVVTADPVSSSD